MNNEMKKEEEVFLRFLVSGEKMVWVPKKVWEEEYADKIGAATDKMELTDLALEMEGLHGHGDEWFEYDLNECYSE